MLIGSHVSIVGGLPSAAKEAVSYGANTFMLYTGGPKNSRRYGFDVFAEKMKIDEGKAYMKQHGIGDIVVHAPYILNMASPKDENFEFSAGFLKDELQRADMLGAKWVVVHPGAFTESSAEAGIKRIQDALNIAVTAETTALVCLEMMAGKGTELGKNFDEMPRIIDGVRQKDRVAVCFDTCHAHDGGYDIVNDFEGVMADFNKTLGADKLAVFHINGSLNERGAKKDRHANIGAGEDNPTGIDKIGFEAIYRIVHSIHSAGKPLILETPWLDEKTNLYKEEIVRLRG